MDDILIYMSYLAPIVLAMTEVVKRATEIDDRYVPLIALAIGILIGIAASPFISADVFTRMWAGALAGLSAVGLFEGGKAMLPPSKPKDEGT